jgi:hypothetical protein
MGKIFYDTEFLENGKTIEFISIGMVNEHGNTYYAVNATMPWGDILKHEWLVENVVPHLPLNGSMLDFNHPSVKSRSLIAQEVQNFVLRERNPRLWAYYGAYDHVVMCQLFGKMIDLPEGFPMFTNDLKTFQYYKGNPRLPIQDPGSEHNALDDALWVKDAYQFLMNYS